MSMARCCAPSSPPHTQTPSAIMLKEKSSSERSRHPRSRRLLTLASSSTAGISVLDHASDVWFSVLTQMPYDALGRLAMTSLEFLRRSTEITKDLLRLSEIQPHDDRPPLQLLAQIKCAAMLTLSLRETDCQPAEEELDRLLAVDAAFHDDKNEAYKLASVQHHLQSLTQEELRRRFCTTRHFSAPEGLLLIKEELTCLRNIGEPRPNPHTHPNPNPNPTHEPGGSTWNDWSWSINNSPAVHFEKSLGEE